MRWLLILVVALSCSPVLACSGDDADRSSELLVFAAASLTDAFTAIGEEFEGAHPGLRVTFSFASSSALAVQLTEGAPADVFASADLAQMAVVVEAGEATASARFVRNRPVVAVPAGSSAVASFEELANEGIRLVLAAPDVPIGRYAREVLANASAPGGIAPEFADQVLANLQSNETNVRAVLTKVQLGEADAGIVYASDLAAAAGEVEAVPIPEAFNVVAEYPIAVLADAPNAETAETFVAFVQSEAGAQILADHGFAPE